MPLERNGAENGENETKRQIPLNPETSRTKMLSIGNRIATLSQEGGLENKKGAESLIFKNEGDNIEIGRRFWDLDGSDNGWYLYITKTPKGNKIQFQYMLKVDTYMGNFSKAKLILYDINIDPNKEGGKEYKNKRIIKITTQKQLDEVIMKFKKRLDQYEAQKIKKETQNEKMKLDNIISAGDKYGKSYENTNESMS